MTTSRKRSAPVGLGYLPKGGRAAGAAHNAGWTAAREAATAGQPSQAPRHAVASSAADPLTGAGRTDVRASARPTGRRTERVAVVGASAVAALAGAGLLEWLLR